MTEAQRARLPEILREIVDCDRNIADLRHRIGGTVVPIDAVRSFAGRRTLRRELTERASGLYGYQLRGSDPTHA